MEPFAIWHSPRKLRRVTAAAILRGVVGVMGVTFALLAVFGIVAAVRLGRGPALVIDDRGVTDRTALGSVGFMPWEQALAFIPGRDTHKGFVIVRYAHPQWPEEQLRGFGRARL